MWGLGIGIIAGTFAYVVFLGVLGSDDFLQSLQINIVSIMVNIALGMKGNEWRENNLAERGYEHKDTVTAANHEGAVALFLKEQQRTGVVQQKTQTSLSTE